jgi:Resolvase, N terminal domain
MEIINKVSELGSSGGGSSHLMILKKHFIRVRLVPGHARRGRLTRHLETLAGVSDRGPVDLHEYDRHVARRWADHLLNVLDTVSKAGAKFKSLADAWADTTTPHGELMITILAGLATFERHLIKARTEEGRKRAQARGVRFGRPLKLSAFQIKEALVRREAGEAMADIGRSYGVSHSTISRL